MAGPSIYQEDSLIFKYYAYVCALYMCTCPRLIYASVERVNWQKVNVFRSLHCLTHTSSALLSTRARQLFV